MTKFSTKRSLFASVIALMLCFSMLLGTTFAWFTDTVTSENNIIKSGTLKVGMYWAEGTEDPASVTWTDASTGAIFNNDKWEPGYAEVRHIKIANEGTLALKYQLAIAAKDEVSKLADVIDVYFVDPAVQVSGRADLAGLTPIGTLTQVLAGMPANASGELLAGANAQVTIALKMQETAGNEYQDLAIGSSFAVRLVATQLEAELDSFGKDYDNTATYPVVVSSSEELKTALVQGGNVVLADDVQFGSTINNDVKIDLADNAFISTGSYKLSGNADLSMSNGDYVVNQAYGHVDVRADSAEGSVVTFENVDFTSNYKNKTYGTSTDRLVSVVEVCPEAEGGHIVAIFKNCTFDNASVLFEGLSGKVGTFEAIFENCTFNALTNTSIIKVDNYIKGTITVKNCTFNLTCTSSGASAIYVSPSNSTSATINAENNTINAIAATPYTYDAAAGETEVDNIKVMGTPAKIKFIAQYGNAIVNETNTTKTGIANY